MFQIETKMRFFGTQIAGKKFRHSAAQERQKVCELQVIISV